jgi:peptidoglycan/LPS O-acetylase OafA/YrhL
LFAAGLVLVSHAFELGGFGNDGDRVGLGPLAVSVFFILSGFLVTRSLMGSRRISTFLRRRACRILPGYWVCLIVTAFAFGGVLWWHDHGSLGGFFSAPDGPVRYVQRNFLLFQRQKPLAGLLTDNPWPFTFNGSLWTLINEARCYLLLAALGALGLIRSRRAGVLIPLAAFWWIASMVSLPVHLGTLSLVFPLHDQRFAGHALAFTLGALAWVYAERIPMHRLGAAIACGILMVLLGTNTFSLFGTFPLAYAVLFVASTLPVRRLNTTTDISYGVYIYAYPVQQTLAAFGAHQTGIVPYFVAILLITGPLAWLSWRLVERPMMRLRYGH